MHSKKNLFLIKIYDMLKKLRLFFLFFFVLSSLSFAQNKEEDEKKKDEEVVEKESVVFEVLYDEPYDVYKLWIKFQPLYFDVFMSNVTAGFGFEAQFIEYEMFDLNLSIRKPYSTSTDVYRNAGEQNNDFTTTLQPAFFAEIGGSYHVYDKSKEGIAKIVLRKEFNSVKAKNREKNKPIEFVKVGCQVREIVGIRAGFMTYSNTVNLSDAAIRQGIKSYQGNQGTVIDNFVDNRLYGNLNATGLYLGGSYSQFRNVIIKPEDYNNLGNDILITAYADLLIIPSFNFTNVFLAGEAFDMGSVNTNPVGFRLGLEGKFNQKFTYSYAFETGIRPSVSKRGAFALVKLSFPVLATSLKMEKEAFESVGDN